MLKIMIKISRYRIKIYMSFISLIVCCFIFATSCFSSTTINDGVYEVRKVIDGDTVELQDGVKVRFIGINAPEKMKKVGEKWIFSPEPLSLESKRYTEKLIDKERIKLEFDKDKIDEYGRMLAYVFLEDGKMINAELIRKGLATVYTFYPNIKYLDKFLYLQNEAIKSERGLWKQVRTINSDEANQSIGKMRNVLGKVSRTYFSKNYLNLEMIEDSARVFTAQIPLRNMLLFKKKGFDPPKDYFGKFLSVTGKIKQGPSMYIDNPTQIKIKAQIG